MDAPIPLFTPTHNGLYRITGYVQATGNPAMICSGFCVQVSAVFAPNAGRLVAGFGGGISTAVPGISGQVIGYYTSSFGGPSMNYDLVIVVEELETANLPLGFTCNGATVGCCSVGSDPCKEH